MEQEKALASLASAVHERGQWTRMSASIARPADDERSQLLRFLRARHFDVDKSLQMLLSHLDWRDTIGIDRIKSSTPSELLGCDSAVLDYYLPSVQSGNDKQGRPVIWSKHGAFDVEALLRYTTAERLAAVHVWEHEQVARRLCEQSAKHQARISQLVAVVDLKGWHLGLMSRAGMRFIGDRERCRRARHARAFCPCDFASSPCAAAACPRVLALQR